MSILCNLGSVSTLTKWIIIYFFQKINSCLKHNPLPKGWTKKINSKFPFGRLGIVEIQDTKMHTHIWKSFIPWNLKCLNNCPSHRFVQGFYLYSNLKCLVKGFIWIKFIELGAHHRVSMFGDGLCDTQMHIMPSRKHTHGEFKCLV
jgi:hypothetical protein